MLDKFARLLLNQCDDKAENKRQPSESEAQELYDSLFRPSEPVSLQLSECSISPRKQYQERVMKVIDEKALKAEGFGIKKVLNGVDI